MEYPQPGFTDHISEEYFDEVLRLPENVLIHYARLLNLRLQEVATLLQMPAVCFGYQNELNNRMRVLQIFTPEFNWEKYAAIMSYQADQNGEMLTVTESCESEMFHLGCITPDWASIRRVRLSWFDVQLKNIATVSYGNNGEHLAYMAACLDDGHPESSDLADSATVVKLLRPHRATEWSFRLKYRGVEQKLNRENLLNLPQNVLQGEIA